MIEKRNIQDEYLEKFKNEGKELTVFLTNGFQLRGTIVDFDQYVIDILSQGKNLILCLVLKTRDYRIFNALNFVIKLDKNRLN